MIIEIKIHNTNKIIKRRFENWTQYLSNNNCNYLKMSKCIFTDFFRILYSPNLQELVKHLKHS